MGYVGAHGREGLSRLCGASGLELAQTDQQALARWTRKRSVVGYPRRVQGNQASPQGHWDAAWGTLGVSEEVARAEFPGLGSKSQGLHGPPSRNGSSACPLGLQPSWDKMGLVRKSVPAAQTADRQAGGPRREL